MERSYICESCGLPGTEYDWVQVALDDTHEVFYTAYECPEGYRVIDVDVYELTPKPR